VAKDRRLLTGTGSQVGEFRGVFLGLSMAKKAGPSSTLPCRFSYALDFNKTFQSFWFLFLSRPCCIIQHALEINDDYGFIPDNPGVVSGFE
jgi:hypothetical protein